MLVSDGVYKRIPRFWMVLGVLFVGLGFMAGTDVDLFPLYIGLGFLCIGRSLWIYQARWKYFRKNKINIARTTVIRRNDLPKKQDPP